MSHCAATTAISTFASVTPSLSTPTSQRSTERLRDLGAEPVGSSSAEQDAILKRQMDQFRPIVTEMKLES